MSSPTTLLFLFNQETLPEMESTSENINSRLNAVLLVEKTKNANSDNILKADQLYKMLLESGLIEKKGFNLRGIEDVHLFRPSIQR